MNNKPESRPWPVAPKKTIRLRVPGPRGKCFTNRPEWEERMAAKQIKPRPRRKVFRIKEQANMHDSIIQYMRNNAESDESDDDDDSGTLIPGNDVLNSIASINISGSQKEIGHNSGEAINEIQDCETEPHNQHLAITTASLNPEHAIYTEPGVTDILTQRRGKSTDSVQVRRQNDGPPVPACLASSAEYLDEEMCTVTPFLELFAMSTITSTETDVDTGDEEEMDYRYIRSSFASQTALECWLNEHAQCFEEAKLMASAMGIDRIDDKQPHEDDEQYEDDDTQHDDDERQYVEDPQPTPESKAYQQQVLGRLWALMARNNGPPKDNCKVDDSFDAGNTSASNTDIEDDEIQRKDSEHQYDDDEIHYEDKESQYDDEDKENQYDDNEIHYEDNNNEASEYEEVSQDAADWKAYQKRASRTLSTIYEAQSFEEEYLNQYVCNSLLIHQMKAYEEQKARRILTLLQRMDDPPNEDCEVEHSFYFNNASTSKTGNESYEQYVDDEQRDKEPQAITDGNDDQRHVAHGLCTLLARNNGSPTGDCDSEGCFRENNRSDDDQQYEEDPLPIEHYWYEKDSSTSLNLGSSEADMSTEQTRDSDSNLEEPSEDSFFEFEPEASKSPVCGDAEMSIQPLKYSGGVLSKFVQDIPDTFSIAEIDTDADDVEDKYELTKNGLAKCFVDYWIGKQEHYNIEAKALEKALSVEHVTDKDYETNYSPAPDRNNDCTGAVPRQHAAPKRHVQTDPKDVAVVDVAISHCNNTPKPSFLDCCDVETPCLPKVTYGKNYKRSYKSAKAVRDASDDKQQPKRMLINGHVILVEATDPKWKALPKHQAVKNEQKQPIKAKSKKDATQRRTLHKNATKQTSNKAPYVNDWSSTSFLLSTTSQGRTSKFIDYTTAEKEMDREINSWGYTMNATDYINGLERSRQSQVPMPPTDECARKQRGDDRRLGNFIQNMGVHKFPMGHLPTNKQLIASDPCKEIVAGLRMLSTQNAKDRVDPKPSGF
ncbi:uncharacterized protein LOC120906613 isoform X2 [Anopheles arabiensis]|uniref:uncharacterized protein LOC120906613 isoform X2 n=1 Tax=Anopheles arabiensis TaxID=7173 RepID=UPI001AACA306|nr:uncharacterized protein LOC120906613 isoform X2 [Anopheles arabiensis]